MKKILCSAQTFGFGPISKLYSVARLLKDEYELDLILDSERNIFPSLNPGVFTDLETASGLEDLEQKINRFNPDAILSFFEPDIVLQGRRLGVPSYFVDGLFWFWKTRSIDYLQSKKGPLLASESAGLRDSLRELTPHERIFISHLLAHKSFVLSDSQIGPRIKEFEGYLDISVVGAVLNNSYKDKTTTDEIILVSLSGEIVPLITEDKAANYARLVISMIEKAADEFFIDKQWVVLANPLIVPYVSVNHPRITLMSSVSQEKMYDLQRKAAVVFSPPGLTTIYECASLGKPLVFLPEQSTQYENAYRLQSLGYPLLGGFFHDLIPWIGDADGLNGLYIDTIPRFMNSIESIYQHVFDCIHILESGYRKEIAAAQSNAVIKMVGSFTGAQEIAERLRMI